MAFAGTAAGSKTAGQAEGGYAFIDRMGHKVTWAELKRDVERGFAFYTSNRLIRIKRRGRPPKSEAEKIV